MKRISIACLCLLAGSLSALAEEPQETPAEQLARAEILLTERKFDDCLAVLGEIVVRQDEDRAIAAMAQYRLGLYRGWIKKCSIEKSQSARNTWLPIIEADLRKVISDFPEQTEAVNLSRVKLVLVLIGQERFDEAEAVAQQVLDTTPDSPRYQALARLRLVEVGLARILMPGTEGMDIHAAHVVAIPELEQVVALVRDSDPDVTNTVRLKLLYALVFTWQFDLVPQVCQAVLADHAAGRADDEQTGRALIYEATALTRQKLFEEAIEPLEMAAAVADPNYLDVVYEAQADLRKVYQTLTEQEYKLGEEALFARDDPTTARAYFEAAHEQALLGASDRLELIRVHLAQLAQRDGEIDRAIAWWRLAIENPAKLSGRGFEAADVIAWLFRISQRPIEEEAWRLYLLDPSMYEDPTAPTVIAELGTTPAEANEQDQDPVTNVPGRLVALGKLYNRERRFHEAKAVFQEALTEAETDQQEADALTGIAYCRRRLEGRAAALETADQAVDRWLAVLNETASEGTAHYAIDMAAATYAANAFPEKTLSLMEHLRDSLSPEKRPSSACFARYRLMLEYECQRRYADAQATAEELLSLFLEGEPFHKGHSTLCGNTMFHLAYLHARQGDLVFAHAKLDELARRWPEEFEERMPICRSSVEAAAASSAQEE